MLKISNHTNIILENHCSRMSVKDIITKKDNINVDVVIKLNYCDINIWKKALLKEIEPSCEIQNINYKNFYYTCFFDKESEDLYVNILLYKLENNYEYETRRERLIRIFLKTFFPSFFSLNPENQNMISKLVSLK